MYVTSTSSSKERARRCSPEPISTERDENSRTVDTVQRRVLSLYRRVLKRIRLDKITIGILKFYVSFLECLRLFQVERPTEVEDTYYSRCRIEVVPYGSRTQSGCNQYIQKDSHNQSSH